jgi:hypothetical protein
MDENIFGFDLEEPLTKEKTKSIRVSDWTYEELTELKDKTGVTYGNLVRQAIPLLQKKYKIKKEFK